MLLGSAPDPKVQAEFQALKDSVSHPTAAARRHLSLPLALVPGTVAVAAAALMCAWMPPSLHCSLAARTPRSALRLTSR